MAKKKSDSGWEYLLELAESNIRDQRQISLIRSYSWVEHALEACGLKRDKQIKSISQLLHLAYERKLLSTNILLSDIKSAISTRHLAAHVDSVPLPQQCKSTVKILQDVWISLRKSQINLVVAEDIARRISELPNIISVNLYGSLARNAKEPQDFDLLVFDDGTYSQEIDKTDLAYLDRVKITNISLDLLGLTNNRVMKNLAKCRWIDVTILDGELFGNSPIYTSEIASYQPDPYFFLNIASDILQYNTNKNNFEKSNMEIFVALRKLRLMLQELGI